MISVVVLLLLTSTDGGTPCDVSKAFLEMPLQFGGPGSAERASTLTKAVVDVPNGYLSVRSDANPGPPILELAVFRRKRGTCIVGLKESDERQFPPQATLNFYEVSNGRWTDITSEVLPKDVLTGLWDGSTCTRCERGISWSLPQEGTNVTVTGLVARNHGLDEVSTTTLRWDRERGVLVSTRTRR